MGRRRERSRKSDVSYEPSATATSNLGTSLLTGPSTPRIPFVNNPLDSLPSSACSVSSHLFSQSFCLASLRSRKAFVSEKNKKTKSFLLWGGRKQQGRGFEQPVTSELTSAQCPHVSPSLQREHSSVLFTQHDQRPSMAASDMISFCESDSEMDDSLSLVALDVEELSGSVTDPSLLPLSTSRNARLRTDEELIRVITKASPPPTLVTLLPLPAHGNRMEGNPSALRSRQAACLDQL